MRIGKIIRLSNIIDPSDGKCIMFAADHNFLMGPIKGLENVKSTLKRALKGKPDAIMLSPGQAKRLSYMFGGRDSPALVIRGDWANCFRERIYALPTRSVQEVIVADPKDLIRLGAIGAVFYFFTGYGDKNDEARHYERLNRFLRNCEEVGLPCLVTVIPMGESVTGANFTSLLEIGVRMAAEAGADAVEVPYTQDVDTFRKIVKAAKGIPTLCAGGPKAATIRDSLEVVVELLEAGASGVVFGRQVFQSEDPARYLKMLYALIHEGKSIEDVLSIPKGRVEIKAIPHKCSGCRLCEFICSLTHEDVHSPWNARLHVEQLKDGYEPLVCTLCKLCLKACQEGALEINPTLGYIQLHREKCVGCKECVNACPLNIIKFDEKGGIPLVCDMCEGDPQCVKWCPSEALVTKAY